MNHVTKLFVLFFVFLTGCTSIQYGSFVAVESSANQKLANDVVQELIKLSPPARSHFILFQPVKDDFGTRLVNSLRLKGYAIEQSSSLKTAQYQQQKLYYILDMPINKTLYRVTISFGEQKISRAYVLKNGVLIPASVWIRKE